MKKIILQVWFVLQLFCIHPTLVFCPSFRWMGCFGAWSQKPQLGLSNVGWAEKLYTPMTSELKKRIAERAQYHEREMVRKTVSKHGGKLHVTLGRE